MKNETNKTAVEWLVGELMSKGIINFGGWVWDDNISIVEIIEQAKEIEKEQIVNAWIDDRFPLDKEWVKQCAEQYYNETFNTKEK